MANEKKEGNTMDSTRPEDPKNLASTTNKPGPSGRPGGSASGDTLAPDGGNEASSQEKQGIKKSGSADQSQPADSDRLKAKGEEPAPSGGNMNSRDDKSRSKL